jgi:hypothetical protein
MEPLIVGEEGYISRWLMDGIRNVILPTLSGQTGLCIDFFPFIFVETRVPEFSGFQKHLKPWLRDATSLFPNQISLKHLLFKS